MTEETEAPKGFKVSDKRRFTEEGEVREESAEQAESTSRAYAEPTNETSPDPSEDSNREANENHEELPSINFPTFIMSLSTQALMHLGEIDNPVTGKAEKDVAVAKQTIDIIAMLSEKSAGNLDETEEQLVREILYNLRMRYVEAVRTT